jgi:hypothetical protein
MSSTVNTLQKKKLYIFIFFALFTICFPVQRLEVKIWREIEIETGGWLLNLSPRDFPVLDNSPYCQLCPFSVGKAR